MSFLFNHILQNGDPTPIDPNLELLAMPFSDPGFFHPRVLMSDPPMFFFILVVGSMDIITSLCRMLASRVAGLLQLRDRKGRGPAHFAAAGSKCRLFADTLASCGCQELLVANALERDTYGLLPIHYASCLGSILDVEFCIDCGSNYAALTEDVNEYSILELALKSTEFDLAKWLLTETTVPWSELSPGAGICISGSPSVSEAEYAEIFRLLETSGIDPVMPRHDENLLMHAIAEKSPVLLLACLQYRSRFSPEMLIAVCDEACRSSDLLFVHELFKYRGVPITALHGAGHSLLWTAVTVSSVDMVHFLLSRCGNHSEWHDFAAVIILALRLGHEDIINELDQVVPL
jgi:hypothetical protein